MSPVYDGRGQPSTDSGWFSGLVSWWSRLTPTYVTPPSRGTGAVQRSSASSMTTTRSPEAPAGATGKASVSSNALPAAAETIAIPTPPATKP